MDHEAQKFKRLIHPGLVRMWRDGALYIASGNIPRSRFLKGNWVVPVKTDQSKSTFRTQCICASIVYKKEKREASSIFINRRMGN